MFHLGGVQKWKSWLENENNTSWASMDSTPLADADKMEKDTSGQDVSMGGVSIIAEMLESAIVPLQSNEIGMSPAEKFNVGSAACVRYIDWAVKEMRDGGLAVRNIIESTGGKC